mmetsp:Transcript_7713/g.21626  ORF Transcript_7713/g.21626 Transcript_7713/m.21626 type:complete len:116 (-) Transcript_7713:1596-1943(-)
MHVRKNAAFPRFDIKKYILVIREIESICRRTALEPIIYEVCVTLIIKCIARVSNPDDTAILDCTALVQHKPEEHPWAWHKICKIVFLVETWTNVTFLVEAVACSNTAEGRIEVLV